nr:Alpha-ketoglutarate-dependent dioxygenase alkB 7, mitochondrial [Polyrhizophydium stewartii]
MLVLETTKKLRRLFGRQGYLEGHLDTVIKGYKEATISGWMTAATAQNEDEARVVAVLERVKDAMDEWLGRDRAVKWGPPHLLDLRNGNSGIGAHVDFVQESGAVIGGVCLLSPSVIVFRHKDRPDTDHFKLLAPPRALYMQADNIRYDYSHEIPMTDDPNHSFRGEFVERERRISIMMRDKLVLKPGQLPMFAARQSSQ